jgi:ribosomal protein S18 acetylase RimI-like enzyme
MQETIYTGGCLCGDIRFRADGPALRPHDCSCSFCQKHTGALTASWVEFPKEKVLWEGPGGAPATYRSSDYSSRAFCPRCGSSLGAIDDEPAVALLLGTFDNAKSVALKPGYHSFEDGRPDWMLPEKEAAAVIRPATPEDVEAIFHIRTSVKENHLSREQLHDMGITEDAIREAIANEPCAFVAEIDGVPVGFSMADMQEGSVFAAFILPDFEGRGLGRLLMHEVEACLFRNHERIWLETARGSRAAGFYHRLGWFPVGDTDASDIRLEKSRDQATLR